MTKKRNKGRTLLTSENIGATVLAGAVSGIFVSISAAVLNGTLTPTSATLAIYSVCAFIYIFREPLDGGSDD